MSKYIDAVPLHKEIRDFKKAVKSPNSDYMTGYICALSVVEGMIFNTPTADVVEVRHGHWIKEFAWSYGYFDHHKLTCSECGLTFTEDARNVDEYKYCYGCGAKMDLERRSENEG